MSEEAVRQTRSQKRALEREAPPPSTDSPSIESDRKKPKLEDSGAECQDQDQDQDQEMTRSSTTPEPDPTPSQDGPSRTNTEPELGKDPESEPTRLTLPEPLASPAQPVKDERDQNHKQTAETGSNSIRSERASRARTEPVLDSRNKARLEPRGAGAMLSAGEVKATIKVEVQTGEQPVDMSTSRSSSIIKREKRPPTPDDDDVIILSDNDSPSPPMNGLSHLKELDTDLLMKSSPEERDRIIQQLKEELRLEEAKLVLLKKLRQSQVQKETLQKPSGLSGSAPPPLIRGAITANKGSQQVVTGRSSGTVIPPPLVRGGQQLSSKHGSQVIMPPLVRGAQVSHGPRTTSYVQPISVSPQQIQALRQQQQQQLAASGGSSSGSGPPPLLLAPRNSATGAQGQRGLVQSGLIRVGNVSNASLLVNISQASATNLKGSSLTSQSGSSGVSVVNVNDSPASRQAAAKLALRKQLEKTLLEIPPPKPPAPEFSFHPSAANNEFIYLVGLEDVVQNLLDTFSRAKNPGAPYPKPAAREPYTCTQCSTDFTCRWRQDKAKGGTILCEECMTSNQKKALKAEHTNRLKAAFVKALQQEQEIEQRILQPSASPVSHTPSSSSSSSSSSPSIKVEQLVSQQLKQSQARANSLQQHHQHSRGQHNIVRHHSTNTKQSPQGQLSRGGVTSVGGVRSVPHSFSSSSQLQSAVAAAALVNRPGKHAHHASRPSAQSSKVSGMGGGGGGSIRGTSGGSASATAWRKQNSSNTGVTMAYVNPSLSGHKTSSTVDARQREYLLDMIPSRSISQTANTWK